jgi:short-subunit dehydrogenase
MRRPASLLITGATGSIGSALAQAYAAAGVTLVLQGRDAIRLGEVAASCREKGAEVRMHTIDLTDAAALDVWLRELASEEPVELLIANAGMNINTGSNGEGEAWEEVEALLALNVRSTMALVHAVLPGMKQRGRGQIALVSSLAAWFGLPATPSYCASKAALKAYGEALRGGLATAGVEVNVVMPGYVESAMCRAMPGPKPFLWTAERAAHTIKRGLARNQARISFPFPLNLGTWLLAVIHPVLAQWFLKRLGYGG